MKTLVFTCDFVGGGSNQTPSSAFLPSFFPSLFLSFLSSESTLFSSMKFSSSTLFSDNSGKDIGKGNIRGIKKWQSREIISTVVPLVHGDTFQDPHGYHRYY